MLEHRLQEKLKPITNLELYFSLSSIVEHHNDMFNNLQNKLRIINNLEVASGIFISTLMLILPLLYIGSLRDPSSLPRYTLYGISSGIILSLVLFKSLIEHKPPVFQRNFFLTIIILLGWAWFSLSWSIDPKNSLLELIQLTGCIIISLSISQITNFRILTFIIIFSVAGGSIVSAIGIAQYFNYNPLAYRQFSVPASTFTNPNIATTYIDLIIPLAFSFIFIAKNKTYKFFATISAILCLSFILISHSRGSWLGLVLALIGLPLLIYKNPEFKNIFIPLLIQNKLFIIVSIFISFLIFSIPSTVTIQEEIAGSAKLNISSPPLKSSRLEFDTSSKIRLDAYINSLAMIKDHPVLGSGYGGFKIGFRNYMFHTVPFNEATEDKFLARLHNDPLQAFVELGLIGGILFIYLYIIILQACWKIIKSTKNVEVSLITSGIFLAILTGGIHSFVDFPFHKPTSALQFWIWFAIVITISAKIVPVKVISINRFITALLIIFGLIFSIYNFSYYQNYLYSSKHRLSTERALKKENCKLAQKHANLMMDLFDADYRHQSLYVYIYSKCEIDNSEKLSAMNRILNYDKTNTRAFITRGTIYLQQKSTQSAINDFLQVTRILPHRASGYIGLAYASLQNQNKPAAIKLLKHASKIEPENKISLKLLNELTMSY